MPFERTQDVLKHMQRLHNELHDYYEAMDDSSDRSNLKLLLDYISRHEESLVKILNELRQGHNERVLDSWFQHTPIESTFPLLQESYIQPRMSASEVFETAMNVDNYLLNLYKGLALSTVHGGIKHLMEQLLEKEKCDEVNNLRLALEKL